MKLIYLTAKRYPGTTADHHYVENLARAFGRELGGKFTFVVSEAEEGALSGIPLVQVVSPTFLKRTLFFFFWIPWHWCTTVKKDENTVFFSNDQNLLALLIFWKKLLSLSYRVAPDWHMLSHTWKDRFIARTSDCSISTSRKLERAVRELAPLASIHTVYGAVDGSPFEKEIDRKTLREKLSLPADRFLISYVGLFKTMKMEKGISTMIRALSELPSDCAMVFVGGKPDEIGQYAEEARLQNVFDRCIFLPIQSFENVVRYERAMDILVIPYPDKPHFRSFGFPMKIYEYMASRTPIIYTKLELLEEVVSDCAKGVTPDSPSELAQAISFLRSHPEEARDMALKAFEKAKHLTWEAKAHLIVKKFAILPIVLHIPHNALAYILFQRTEFSIYATRRWLLRLVMNRRIPIYNAAVRLEAFLFPSRTKRLFSADMEREYDIIKEHLPSNLHNILDIGCGVAGIDIMIHAHNKNANFHLLDKTEVNSKVYYGLEKEAAYYNSLGIAKEMLVANGVESSHVFLQEVTGAPLFPGKKFDLIISLISWGFHYPISTYLDYALDALLPGGRLIIDVRKDTDGEALLEEKFGPLRIIYEAQKYRRLLVIKK